MKNTRTKFITDIDILQHTTHNIDFKEYKSEKWVSHNADVTTEKYY